MTTSILLNISATDFASLFHKEGEVGVFRTGVTEVTFRLTPTEAFFKATEFLEFVRRNEPDYQTEVRLERFRDHHARVYIFVNYKDIGDCILTSLENKTVHIELDNFTIAVYFTPYSSKEAIEKFLDIFRC